MNKHPVHFPSNLKPLIIDVLLKIDKTDTFRYPLNTDREIFADTLLQTLNARSYNFINYVNKAEVKDIHLEHILYTLNTFLSSHLLINGNKRLLVALLTTFLEYYVNLYPIKEFYKADTINTLIITSQKDKDHFKVLKDFVKQYFSNTKLENNHIHLTQLINDLVLM